MAKIESGFTLLETLVVLLVASLLLIVPTLSMSHMVEAVEIDLFFRELTSNITLMQNHAVLAGEQTEVNFMRVDSGHAIRFQASHNHLLNRIMYIDSPNYSLRTRELISFHFLANTGNISHSKTIKFYTDQGTYELTYLLGSGRFDIKKENK